MSSRRLVLAAADHLVTAISLAFWLNHRAKAVALVAIPLPLAKGLPGAAADSISIHRTPGFCATADPADHALRTGRTPASPIAPRVSARARLVVFDGVSRPNSSGSEQIPLLVGRARELQTGLTQTETHPCRPRFDSESLNSNLSLERAA
jgi:hypothetical protein